MTPKSRRAPAGIQAETEILIPFHDVDSMGIVWHGHYAKYFELARCVLLDRIGFGYKEMAASEWAWPVIDCRSRFAAPLRFEQQVVVTAVLREWDMRLRIDYEIRDMASGRRHTRGRTVQVAVDRISGDMVVPVPLSVQEIFAAAVASA